MKNVTTLIISTLLATTALFPLHVNADEEQQMQYEMVAVGNQAFGDLVLKGKYQLAVTRINASGNFAPHATATNLCVALTMLGKYDQAEPQCDEATKQAEKSPPRGRDSINQVKTQRAFAYSNRGVMRLLSGNVSGAKEDFLTAIERKADLHTPTRNLAKANVETTAQFVAIVSH
jgi:hypothetical protein